MKLIIAIFAMLPLAVLADDSATPAPADKVPVIDCQKPTLPPKIEPTSAQVKRFNAEYAKYKPCVMGYVDRRQKDAKQYNALAQAHQDAANAAIHDYNEFAKQSRAAAPESEEGN